MNGGSWEASQILGELSKDQKLPCWSFEWNKNWIELNRIELNCFLKMLLYILYFIFALPLSGVLQRLLYYHSSKGEVISLPSIGYFGQAHQNHSIFLSIWVGNKAPKKNLLPKLEFDQNRSWDFSAVFTNYFWYPIIIFKKIVIIYTLSL